MSKITTIKGALINCIVGKKAVDDSFQGMVMEAALYTAPAFQDECKKVETEIKSSFGLTATPATYRSKKQLIVKCLEAHINLKDGALYKSEDELKQELADFRATLPVPPAESGIEEAVDPEVVAPADLNKLQAVDNVIEQVIQFCNLHGSGTVVLHYIIKKLKEEHAKRTGTS